MTKITFETLINSWRTYIIRLLMTMPEDGIAALDGRERRKRRNGTWMLWALVAILAIASITNLSDRAYTHKQGFSANVVGAGLALLVPVAVHCAIKVSGYWQFVVWFFAIVFAGFSGTIQYQIYAPQGEFIIDKDHLEALVFGAGVPLAECILAGIAAILEVQQHTREKEDMVKAAQEKEDIESIQKTKERDDKLFDLELENKRLDAQAKREEKLLKARAKLSPPVAQGVAPPVAQGVAPPVAQGVASNTDSVELRHSKLIEMLHTFDTPSDINKSKLARELGVSRHTVIRDIDTLVKEGRLSMNGKVEIHRNGNGVEVVE